MKKLVLVVLTLAALVISVPAAMARDANWSALDKVWKDQVKLGNQTNQHVRVERLKPNSEWDIVAPDRTQPGAPPGLQRPGRR